MNPCSQQLDVPKPVLGQEPNCPTAATPPDPRDL